jgi:hypothetical protein
MAAAFIATSALQLRRSPDRDESVPLLEQGQKGNWSGNLFWGNPVIRKREQAQHMNAIRRVQKFIMAVPLRKQSPLPHLMDR